MKRTAIELSGQEESTAKKFVHFTPNEKYAIKIIKDKFLISNADLAEAFTVHKSTIGRVLERESIGPIPLSKSPKKNLDDEILMGCFSLESFRIYPQEREYQIRSKTLSKEFKKRGYTYRKLKVIPH